MPKHLFLSDAHIGAFDKKTNSEIENSLCQVSEWCLRNNVQLHILGDLFDYWMEFKNKIPELGETVLRCLEEYNRLAPQPATYITGNHDNWTRRHFKDLGFRVAMDFVALSINGQQVFLHHGDGLSDPEYRLKRPLLHRVLRNKTLVSVYQLLFPGNIGLDIMKKFSAFTRKRGGTNPKPLNRWSEWFLEKHPYDVVICGHDHVERIIKHRFGTYINLGTFFKYKSACLYTNNGFRLVRWNEEKRDFETTENEYFKSTN